MPSRLTPTPDGRLVQLNWLMLGCLQMLDAKWRLNDEGPFRPFLPLSLLPSPCPLLLWNVDSQAGEEVRVQGQGQSDPDEKII